MQKSIFWNRITSLYGSQTSPGDLCMRNSGISTRITHPHGSQTSAFILCLQNNVITSEILVSMGASPHLWFLHAKQRLWIRITSLYGSQTSPVDLYMQNRLISTRIALLNGSQPSSVVFSGKTSTFGSDLQVSKGPRPHLSFFACKTS